MKYLVLCLFLMSCGQSNSTANQQCSGVYCTTLSNAGSSAQMVQGLSASTTVVCDTVLAIQIANAKVSTYQVYLPGDTAQVDAPAISKPLADGYYYPQSQATRGSTTLCWFNITNGALNPNAQAPNIEGDSSSQGSDLPGGLNQ